MKIVLTEKIEKVTDMSLDKVLIIIKGGTTENFQLFPDSIMSGQVHDNQVDSVINPPFGLSDPFKSQVTGSIVFDNQQTNIHLSVKPSWTVIIFTIIWCGLIIIGLLFSNQPESSSVSNTLYHILIWFIWTFIPIGLAKLKVHWDRNRLEKWLDKKINNA